MHALLPRDRVPEPFGTCVLPIAAQTMSAGSDPRTDRPAARVAGTLRIHQRDWFDLNPATDEMTPRPAAAQAAMRGTRPSPGHPGALAGAAVGRRRRFDRRPTPPRRPRRPMRPRRGPCPHAETLCLPGFNREARFDMLYSRDTLHQRGRMLSMFRSVVLVLVSLVLSACAHTKVGPGFIDEIAAVSPAQFTCCADPEGFYPEALIETAFALAERQGAQVAGKMYGGYQEKGFPGRLAGNAAAEAAMRAHLKPFDLVFTGNKSYIWGKIIPGRFSHVVIYLGTEAELRAAGLWSLPALDPLRDDIRAGRVFVEAVTPVVGTVGLARVMESDAVAILRPSLTPGARHRALATFAASLGKPYDYTFEVASTDRLSCTELVALAMPELAIATRLAYGHRVIFPDEIVSQAVRGERMRVVGYMVGTEGGFAWRNTHSLMADMAAYWGVPGSKP